MIIKKDYIPPSLMAINKINCNVDNYRDLVICLRRLQDNLSQCNFDKKLIAQLVFSA
ncbi:hypothetical protein L3V82_03525 [Thiotrichales bacterium 19S3-7]|nr:hypothetical protein [Thiotrichales bacterium 19S3-7]MCF6801283.1 hypothetical protein [Thiotrichales bacterium 19S3-11]